MKSARRASDSNLDFDGMTGDGVNRAGSRFSGNHYSGVQNPNKLMNEGRGPTRGNYDEAAKRVGPPATKDEFRRAPEKVGVSGTERPKVKDIDSQNYGSQYRGSSRKEVEKPRNSDRINIQPKGTNGMGRGETTNPVAIAKRNGNPDGFNYGPSKQY
jgi:hypothetical protein